MGHDSVEVVNEAVSESVNEPALQRHTLQQSAMLAIYFWDSNTARKITVSV